MSSPRSGFGLIELMVALALGMLVVLGMTQLFASSREAYLGQQSSAMLQEDARFVLSKLAREIRMAGMLGCLSVDHIVDAPAAFKTPVSWQGGVLRMISSSAGLQSAKPDWTVVSDCTTVARAYPGARLSLAPGETAFPLRELFYRFEQGQLKVGPNKTVLLDNVAAFDVSFGVADSASAHSALRYERHLVEGARLRSIRIGLTLRDRTGRAKDQAYQLEVALRNRLA